VEPLNAKFADFVAHYGKEELVVITLGLATVGSGCFRLWAMFLYQEGPRMTLTGKESHELTKVQTGIAGLLAAPSWEHAREKTPDPIHSAPRTIIYPSEVEDGMEVIKAGRSRTLPPDIEQTGHRSRH
jgi:hypothetical protein